jgi:fructose-bisphosphate aldolase, class II
MSICYMKGLLQDAAKEGKAVGAFSVGNMEMIIGAVKAAEGLNTPIILQIAEVRLPHSPLSLMGPMMIKAARYSKVDIAVHLDHGLALETVKQALDLGFTSVMFDGSRYDLPQNMELTCQVVKMAKTTGATTEAELGVVGGSEDGNEKCKIVCTDPAVAESFAEKTGVDALAVAIGNAHGHYAAVPKLRLDVLEEIDRRVKIPLVLHGGTGISPEDFRNCISYGVRKINIATANFDALTDGAYDYFQHDGPYNYFSLNEAMVQGVYENVKRHIQIFNNKIPLDQIQ